MFNELKQMGKYLFFAVIANAVYGIVLYYVFTWLAKYSYLWAYLCNFVLIGVIFAIDEYTLKMLESEKLVMQLKKEKDPMKSFYILEKGLANFGSFKTDLYLFYIFILIFSQIIEFNPALVGKGLFDFITANSYSILFLIALDTLTSQFSKDRERMKGILDKLKENLSADEKAE